MKNLLSLISPIVFITLLTSCNQVVKSQSLPDSGDQKIQVKVEKSEAQWKKELSAEEFKVLRKAGTERPYSGDLLDVTEKGTFICAACNNVLFYSNTKFESGTGWPSFYAVATDTSVATEVDKGLGITRTEVLCAKCGGHLGHVFEDGPAPTGLRYCMNSAAMDFEKCMK